MILTGPEILKRVRAGVVRIDPFDESLINPASIDLRLGARFYVYDVESGGVLDSRAENKGREFKEGDGDPIELLPGRLYLGHTLERVWAERLVPVVDGKSSLGRLGVSVHQTAGYGDPGFDGQYTLEFTVVYPTRLYIGQRIAQMRFHETVGELATYKGKYVGKTAEGPVPACPFEPTSLVRKRSPNVLGVGSMVFVRFKQGTGKSEHIVNGQGVVMSFDAEELTVRVNGGTASPNPIMTFPRRGDDWKLMYP